MHLWNKTLRILRVMMRQGFALQSRIHDGVINKDLQKTKHVQSVLSFTSSSNSSYPFRMLNNIQTILTFCTAARNKSCLLYTSRCV